MNTNQSNLNVVTQTEISQSGNCSIEKEFSIMKTNIIKSLAVLSMLSALTACGGGAATSTGSSTTAANISTELVVTPHNHSVPVADIGYQQVRYLLGTGLAGSLSPTDLRTHYSVPTNATGAGQTIAIVDAPASNDMASDLNKFSTYYKLPLCNTTNPCFTQYTVTGAKIPAAGSIADWRGEVALDVEYAHAIAPAATILLVTAKSSAIGDMIAAVQYAATQPNVVAISMSWGINEGLAATAANDNILKGNQAQGIALIASSGDTGDNGSNNEWPAVSPYVTSVGGTSIKTVGYSLPTVATEVAWSLGGGGVSTTEAMPAYQSAYVTAAEKALDPNAKRLVPDVSYNADTMASPVVTMVNGTWNGSGGTSAGAPQWAAIVALLAQDRVNKNESTMKAYLANTAGGLNGVLYNNKIVATGIFDVTSGTDTVSGRVCAICSASTGYDAVTGLGVPNVTNLIALF